MADKRSIYQFASGQGQQNSLLLMDNPDVSASSGYTTEKLSIGELGAVIGAILYTQLLDTNVKNIFGGINELFARCMNIADDYDETLTYYTGDYVFYQNVLYKCTTAITTAEAWDASHWTATSIADEIGRIDGELTANFDYSANEVVIGDYFGYPLYRLYFDIGALPNNSTKSVVVLNRHIRDLINLRIVARTTAGDSFITIPYLSGSAAFNIECDVECTGGETKVNITTHTDRSGLVAFGIIEYLKPV